MTPLTRRAFLSRSLAAAAVGPLLRPAFSLAAAAVVGGFRIFVCDWTLNKRCDPRSFAIARRIGLDGVQVGFGDPPKGSRQLPLFDEAVQDRILEAAETERLPVVSLALGGAEELALDSIRVFKRMKVRVALLAFFGKGDLRNDAPRTADTIRWLKELAPRAEDAGLVYGIESWLKAPELERILDSVRSPAVQVYYDVGNMTKVGENVGEAIRRLGRERICQFHLKDYRDLYGKGSTDFHAVRAALDAIGYRGWLGIEGVRMPLGIEPSIRYDLEYLRPIFPRAAA